MSVVSAIIITIIVIILIGIVIITNKLCITPAAAQAAASWHAIQDKEHLSAYKMDVRDYFGSQKTLVFSGRTGSQGQ